MESRSDQTERPRDGLNQATGAARDDSVGRKKKSGHGLGFGAIGRQVLLDAGWSEIAIGPGYFLAVDTDGRRRAIYVASDLIAEIPVKLHDFMCIDDVERDALAFVKCSLDNREELLARFIRRETCWCGSLRDLVETEHNSCDVCHLT